MPRPILVLRAVLISPGDVQAERDSVIEVLQEVNRDTARLAELHIELSRWETDTHPGFHPEGPQGLIDPILSIQSCDLVILILWSRLGTPTPSGETGTEHEFQTAFTSWEETGRPQIMTYFCERTPQPKSTEDKEQIELVQRFKEQLPKQGLSGKYRELEDFKNTLARDLRNYLQNQSKTIWNQEVAAVREMREARRKEGATVAVLGRMSSRDPKDKKLLAADECRLRLYEIGKELAKASYRLMVYDSQPEYAATEVVRGYVESGMACPDSIRVRRPLLLQQPEFPRQASNPEFFTEESAEKDQWEVAFFPSLSELDGLVMAGNGYFTLLGGLQAVGMRLPMIALAGYGGITADVWEVLKGTRFRFASDADVSLMARRETSPVWPAGCVKSLGKQRKRREALQVWQA